MGLDVVSSGFLPLYFGGEAVDRVFVVFTDTGISWHLERGCYRSLLIGAVGCVVSSGTSWPLHRACSVCQRQAGWAKPDATAHRRRMRPHIHNRLDEQNPLLRPFHTARDTFARRDRKNNTKLPIPRSTQEKILVQPRGSQGADHQIKNYLKTLGEKRGM